LQPILIRGLKRSFIIAPDWADSPLAALRTTPDLFGTEPAPEAIAVARTGRHYRIRLPSGGVLDGSLRDCAAKIDRRIAHNAIAAEDGALALPAAILRNPFGGRIAFIGGRRSGKTRLSLALMAAGWHFEGDEWAIARAEGVAALPRTIRVWDEPRALPSYLRQFVEDAPVLCVGPGENMRTLDPRRIGGSWTLQIGSLAALVFLERNPGGQGGVCALDTELAFGRALALCAGRMSGRAAAALRLAVASAPSFRLQAACPERAAARVMEAWTMTLANPQLIDTCADHNLCKE
jgi:hypothetical protein